MKSSIKLAIGAALALASVQSFAQVAVPPPPYSPTFDLPTTAGNGSAMLTLFSDNDATPYSYEFNLGLHFADLLPSNGMNTFGTTLTWNLTGLNVPGGVAPSDLRWDVTAASTTGSINTPGAFQLETTATPTATVAATNNVLSQVNNNNNTYLTNLNNDGEGTNPHTTTNPADTTYANAHYNQSLNFLLFAAAGDTSATLNFWDLVSGSGGARGNAAATEYAGVWNINLSNDTLTYTVGGSAVPLPAALWLLLSGLTGMGVLGRRKVAVTSAA